MYSVAFLAVVCSRHLFRVRKSLFYNVQNETFPCVGALKWLPISFQLLKPTDSAGGELPPASPRPRAVRVPVC